MAGGYLSPLFIVGLSAGAAPAPLPAGETCQFVMTPKGMGLTAVSGGKTWVLNRRDINLRAHAGLGMLGITRIYQKAPGQAGATDLGSDQAVRPISLVWQLIGHDLASLYLLREELLIALQSRDADPVQLIFNIPGIGNRAADVNLTGDLDFDAADKDSFTWSVAATFEAGDPRLYDPALVTVTLTPTAGVAGWTVDDGSGSGGGANSAYGWTVGGSGSGRGWLTGGSTISGETTIGYAGGSRAAAAEFPQLTISGPISSPVIENVTTGERIDLSGLSVASSDSIVVNLANGPFGSGSPTIRDSGGQSVEEYLTSDSDLGTWHLAPAGELLYDGTRCDGDNLIRFQGGGGAATTQLDVAYYNRYIGA